MKTNVLPETKTQSTAIAFLLLSLCAFIILRLLFLLKAPLSNYGYDYGFYLFAITNPKSFAASSLLTVLWGGYNNPLFFLSQVIKIPPAIVLNELYFIFNIFFGLSLFLLFKKNKTAGVFAVLLAAFSLVQIEGFSMYLWKNLIALPFLILAFKFLEEKRYWLLAFSSLFILITHRTTAIIYLLSVGLFVLWKLVRQKHYRLLAVLAAASAAAATLLYYFFGLKSVILNLINNNNYYVRTGLFLENQNLLALIWPYLLLALPGMYFYIKNKRHPIWPIFTLLCLAWFVLHLPFYRRFILYLDLSLIVFAAYFLGRINFAAKQFKIALAAVLVFLAYQAAIYTLEKQPLIYAHETREIRDFSRPGFVLAVSANDAPWLLGFAKNVRLGAPGLFEDPHTYEQWIDFWQGRNQKEFADSYPRPLYFYQRSYLMQGPVTECLKPVSDNFYIYECK